MGENESASMESRQLHSSQKKAMKKILEFSGESNKNQQRSLETTRRHNQPEQPSKQKTANLVFIKGIGNDTPQTTPIDTESAFSITHATNEHTYSNWCMRDKWFFHSINNKRSSLLPRNQLARRNSRIVWIHCRKKLELTEINDLVLVEKRNIRNKIDVRHERPYRINQQKWNETLIIQHMKRYNSNEYTHPDEGKVCI